MFTANDNMTQDGCTCSSVQVWHVGFCPGDRT